ncbi:MAG TPA: universal stress protein [Actinospica sp.]|nr:universal stress protein [Actinospica sp.]
MTKVQEPPVVVGLDPTEASVGALVWAAREAAAHHAPLTAVYVFDPRATEAVYSPSGARGRPSRREAVARVEELIERADVGPLELDLEIGVPGRVLVHRSRGARMLVLGQSRRHRHDAGAPYPQVPAVGSVARACTASAECPVVLVPEGPATLGRDRPEPERHEALHGGRALYPFQGRIPVAHQ